MKIDPKQCRENYRRIIALVPQLETMEPGAAVKLLSEGFQDLHVEVLSKQGTVTSISMAHYYEQNGDLVPDPDMQLFLMHVMTTALPVHFQNAVAYRVCMNGTRITDETEFADQSEFLSLWLGNLEAQGHRLPLSIPNPQGE